MAHLRIKRSLQVSGSILRTVRNFSISVSSILAIASIILDFMDSAFSLRAYSLTTFRIGVRGYYEWPADEMISTWPGLPPPRLSLLW